MTDSPTPTVSVSGSGSDAIVVASLAPKGTIVGQASVASTTTQPTSWSLTGPGAAFLAIGKDGAITLSAKAPDFASVHGQSYTVTAVAHYGAKSYSGKSAAFGVTDVAPVGDHAPTGVHVASLSPAVDGNAAMGAAIMKVAADDVDAALSAKGVAGAFADALTYSLGAGSTAGIAIDATSGLVTATGAGIAPGKASAVVVATDAYGLTATKTIGFTVAGDHPLGVAGSADVTDGNASKAIPFQHDPTSVAIKSVVVSGVSTIAYDEKAGGKLVHHVVPAGQVTVLHDPKGGFVTGFEFTPSSHLAGAGGTDATFTWTPVSADGSKGAPVVETLHLHDVSKVATGLSATTGVDGTATVDLMAPDGMVVKLGAATGGTAAFVQGSSDMISFTPSATAKVGDVDRVAYTATDAFGGVSSGVATIKVAMSDVAVDGSHGVTSTAALEDFMVSSTSTMAMLTMGAGDTVSFGASGGMADVTGFVAGTKAGHGSIVVSDSVLPAAHTDAARFAAVLKDAVDASDGSSTTLTLDAAHVLKIEGVHKAQLSSADFHFVA